MKKDNEEIKETIDRVDDYKVHISQISPKLRLTLLTNITKHQLMRKKLHKL